jgi:hypothetical protein
MKLERIETPDYTLWVSNDEIKEGDYHVAIQIVERVGSKAIAYTDKEQLKAISEIGGAKKIIAYQPKGNAPELDLPLLPEREDDVEKLADLFSTDESKVHPADSYIAKQGFIEGYKAATKVYSEEDMIRIAIHCWNIASKPMYGATYNVNEIALDYMKSIKQPKWFVAEMDYLSDTGEWKPVLLPSEWKTDTQTRLKTTTVNGKIYLVGTYLYE